MTKSTDPTIEEIQAACLLIQSEWSAEEKWSRLRSDWRPTYRRVDGEHPEMTSEDYTEHHGRPHLSDDDFDLPGDGANLEASYVSGRSSKARLWVAVSPIAQRQTETPFFLQGVEQ